jgi:arylsulfatase A-like enzyme
MFEKITKYDAEIRYADSELQRLFQYYQQRGFDNKSLWVITSDHGEGVGSHNYWGHGLNVYNEQLRVPLLFYSSQSHSRGQMVEQAVENVDILPTIIELTKGKPCFDHEEGKSLVPLMYQDQPRTYGKTYAFSQRRIYNKIDPQVNNSKVKNYEAGEKYSLQSQGFKYIYRTAGPDEFYNLRTDPYEINNLINQGVDEEVRLRDALLSELAELSKSAHGASEIADKETIEHLKTLGYIQ